MILDQNTHPEKNLYFWGSTILAYLDESERSLGDLFMLLKEERALSAELFYLAMTWLYLLDAIDVDQDRNLVKRCS